MWHWPLKERPRVPTGSDSGAFGCVRKHDIHTGVDLYCANEPSPVYAVEAGVVVYVGPFTGLQAGSPWWLDTNAVAVRGAFGVVLYGEVEAASTPTVGTRVKAGELLAHVAPVLRHDKGLPTKMLHLELYDYGFVEPVWWRLDEEKPVGLLDPTDLLLMARGR